MNFESLFISEEKPYKGKSRRDKFLSRLFGIFNEEIIRIWCANEQSPYTDKGRPTICDNGKRYTLDFLLEDKDSRLFITEMKCELEYQNYKYLTLNNKEQLSHHKKPAFRLFLEAAKSPSGVKVKYNKKEVDISGSILVWGRTTEGGSLDVKSHYSIHDVISTESVVADLVKWEDANYKKLIDQYQLWSDQLFNGLLGDIHPGIEMTAGVCGGAACLAGTRIPVWILEQYRRSGASDAELLHSYPGLRAENLVHAWAYVRSHRNEIERYIRENEAA